MTVNDPGHAEAPELLAEYAYRNFSYPSRPSIEITEGTNVPEVIEVEVGVHGRTGVKLVVYGYYQKEYWYNQITPKWSRDRADAERANAETVNMVKAVIESQKQERERAAAEAARSAEEAKAQAKANEEAKKAESDAKAAREAEELAAELAKQKVVIMPDAKSAVSGVSQDSLNALLAKFAR